MSDNNKGMSTLELLRLKHTVGFSNKIGVSCYKKNIPLVSLFTKDAKYLKSIGLNDTLITNFINAVVDEDAYSKDLELYQRINKKYPTGLISIDHPSYPPMLRYIADPPVILYYLGSLDLLTRPMIGMVGARKASVGGERLAYNIGADLCRAGFVVVSGFALGIDINAHLGVTEILESNSYADSEKEFYSPTLAILGSGLFNIYPAKNSKYVSRVIKSGGCFLSEHPYDTPGLPGHFPMRNRLISGTSFGTIVVEASHSSGSLITSRYALEQSRYVFACPVAPYMQNNATNDLLRSGAVLVESASDVLREVSFDISASTLKTFSRDSAIRFANSGDAVSRVSAEFTSNNHNDSKDNDVVETKAAKPSGTRKKTANKDSIKKDDSSEDVSSEESVKQSSSKGRASKGAKSESKKVSSSKGIDKARELDKASKLKKTKQTDLTSAILNEVKMLPMNLEEITLRLGVDVQVVLGTVSELELLGSIYKGSDGKFYAGNLS